MGTVYSRELGDERHRGKRVAEGDEGAGDQMATIDRVSAHLATLYLSKYSFFPIRFPSFPLKLSNLANYYHIYMFNYFSTLPLFLIK